MKEKALVLLITLLTINCYSQNKLNENYIEGYIINNNGDKVNCLILDEDWRKNPESITYKNTNDALPVKGLITNIAEFGYHNIVYKRFSTKIDVSSTQTNKLSNKKDPDFIDKTLFLKYLVKGNVNLFAYTDNNAKLFFFSKDNLNAEQLIYKKYLVSATNAKENNRYKQQLKTNLNCDDLPINNFAELNYNENSLSSIFEAYNKCENLDYVNTIVNEHKKIKFKLYIKPSVNFSSFTTDNSRDEIEKLDFGSNTNLGCSIETEFVLPFNNERSALIFEPTYQRFKSDLENYTYINGPPTTKTTNVSIDYKAVDLLFGLKYYFPVNDISKIQINILYNFNSVDLGSNFDYETPSLTDLGLKGKNYFIIGVGYKYNSKISLEAKISSNQQVISNSYYSTNYKKISIAIGYNLF
ncbi:hypothetical protein [Mariniflexile sp. HMF6888]|uniref:hypothetical protein n=1 Tax=Mariniflexile sp. HMF6888 TaxID=3373086 RepID=UPI0037A0F5AA